jgi:hypothetical protein
MSATPIVENERNPRDEPGSTATPEDGTGAVEQLSGRLMESVIGLAELCTVYLGERLGLYRTLA